MLNVLQQLNTCLAVTISSSVPNKLIKPIFGIHIILSRFGGKVCQLYFVDNIEERAHLGLVCIKKKQAEPR